MHQLKNDRKYDTRGKKYRKSQSKAIIKNHTHTHTHTHKSKITNKRLKKSQKTQKKEEN